MKKAVIKYFTKEDGVKLKNNLKKELTRDLTKSLSLMIDVKLDTKLDEFREEIKQWHSDVFDLIDGLAPEIKDNREFRDVTTNQIVEDRVRIGKLEKKVFGVVTS